MASVTVTPSPGLVVRKESGEVLKAEGETLPLSPWWLRRRADGDVTLTDPEPQAEPKAKK